MKKTALFCGIVALVAYFFMATMPAVFAAQVTIDLDKLSPEDAARVLTAHKKAAEAEAASKVTTAKQFEDWAVVGEKWGKAISAVAKELSVSVNDFIKTPVGKFTVVIIAWKVFGKDLWHIVGGTLAWIAISMIIMWSFKFFHMKKKFVDKATKVTTYVQRYEFTSKDARVGSAVCHVLAFVVITAACLLIVF